MKENFNSSNKPSTQNKKTLEACKGKESAIQKKKKDNEEASPTKFFHKKLREMDLLTEDNSAEGIWNHVNYILSSIENETLKEMIVCFYQSLANDIQHLSKANIRMDLEMFQYMQSKVALELKGPSISLDLQ